MARWLDNRQIPDPERPDRSWTYRLSDKGELVATRLENGQTTAETILDIALGSGTHAVTFLSIHDGTRPIEGLEHRLSYFAHLDGMELTPSQNVPKPGLGPDGFHLPPSFLRDCLECHGTATGPTRDGGVDLETLLPHISCERCHGPGRAHVEQARQEQIASANRPLLMFGPGRYTAEQQVQFCGRCHRVSSMVPLATIRPDNPALTRFPSVGLVQSECYLRSDGALSCTTCHDPHARARSAANLYEPACLSCHGMSKSSSDTLLDPIDSTVRSIISAGPVCTVSPESGCLACHMPKRDAGNGIRFSDHWIRAERTMSPGSENLDTGLREPGE